MKVVFLRVNAIHKLYTTKIRNILYIDNSEVLPSTKMSSNFISHLIENFSEIDT